MHSMPDESFDKQLRSRDHFHCFLVPLTSSDPRSTVTLSSPGKARVAGQKLCSLRLARPPRRRRAPPVSAPRPMLLCVRSFCRVVLPFSPIGLFDCRIALTKRLGHGRSSRRAMCHVQTHSRVVFRKPPRLALSVRAVQTAPGRVPVDSRSRNGRETRPQLGLDSRRTIHSLREIPPPRFSLSSFFSGPKITTRRPFERSRRPCRSKLVEEITHLFFVTLTGPLHERRNSAPDVRRPRSREATDGRRGETLARSTVRPPPPPAGEASFGGRSPPGRRRLFEVIPSSPPEASCIFVPPRPSPLPRRGEDGDEARPKGAGSPILSLGPSLSAPRGPGGLSRRPAERRPNSSSPRIPSFFVFLVLDFEGTAESGI